VSYIDVSFLDPYDYWKKASGAFVRSLTARDDAEAIERISRGAMDTAGELLCAYNLFNELGGAVFGQRITEVNVEQALGFKASTFSREIRDASSL